MDEKDETGRRPRRRRRRRRRRRANNPGSEGTRRADVKVPHSQSSSQPSQPSRPGKRRRRGPKQSPQTKNRGRGNRNSPASRDQRSRRKPTTAANLTEVDLGWDDEPIDLPPEHLAHAVARRRQPADSVIDRIAWGDDSNAPTPTKPIPANRPTERYLDDPDPVTAAIGDDPNDNTDTGVKTNTAAVLDTAVANIAGVRFANAGKIYQFDAGAGEYRIGDSVLVQGDRSRRTGTIASAPRLAPVTRPLKKIIGSARPHHSSQSDPKRRSELMEKAKACARSLNLPVKIFRVEHGANRSKTIVYFSSEKKTEQRELARNLAAALGTRVELRQTGVRDEAKIIGGIGSCGLELCCTTWLPAFVPVSIKNAKDQGLVLNPNKVSGQCGRLKCCLVYEQATYAEARKGLPKLGKRVIATSNDGAPSEGRVVEVDVLHRRIRVNHGEGRFEVYTASQVEPMFPSQQQARSQTKKPRRRRRADLGDSEGATEQRGGGEPLRKRRRRRRNVADGGIESGSESESESGSESESESESGTDDINKGGSQ